MLFVLSRSCTRALNAQRLSQLRPCNLVPNILDDSWANLPAHRRAAMGSSPTLRRPYDIEQRLTCRSILDGERH